MWPLKVDEAAFARLGVDPYAEPVAVSDSGADRADRKHVAAYYTSPLTAVMLSSLAVQRMVDDYSIDDPSRFPGFQVLDFACGDGMLLSASYDQIRIQFIERYPNCTNADIDLLHRRLIEDVIVGFDIGEEQIARARANLMSKRPGVSVRHDMLVCHPVGVDDNDFVHVGSLCLLSEGLEPSQRCWMVDEFAAGNIRQRAATQRRLMRFYGLNDISEYDPTEYE